MASRINHLAVFASAIVFFILGAIWYMPLFGRQYMALTGGGTKPMQAMTTTFVVTFLLGWVLAYVIAIALSDTAHPSPARHGVEFGLFMGIGIFATMSLMDFLYEGRSLVLWGINAGYVVVGMAIMGALIGAWRKKAVAVTA